LEQLLVPELGFGLGQRPGKWVAYLVQDWIDLG
jgi:hypothetical protein